MMTTVYTGKLNALTGDDELDMLMEELRLKTGENWQVQKFGEWVEKRWFRSDIHHCWYELLLEVGGFPPYQVILSATGDINKTKAYIYGCLSGLNLGDERI